MNKYEAVGSKQARYLAFGDYIVLDGVYQMVVAVSSGVSPRLVAVVTEWSECQLTADLCVEVVHKIA